MKNQAVVGGYQSTKFFQGEKWLVLTGLLGFLLAGVCAIWVMLYGGPVAPNGDVSKAFSFNAALGIFLLSTAAIIPLSALGTRSKAFFRWSYIALALYSYAAETVQNFRGVDPRFVENGTPFDETVSFIFTFVALLLVLFYVFLAVQYFRRKSYSLSPKLVVSIRYAMIAVMLSFVAGIWISFNDGRVVGLQGNIIWLHGLGFHALQAVPFVAWISARKSHARFIHITGIAYLLGLVAIGWQTYLGHALLELSVFPILAAACFLIAFIPVLCLLLNKDRVKSYDIRN
ncbi:hypothetical protein [Brevibacillus fortis]|uniref:Uncharacterized protein n=1 Tax=Brevibacillus fortis TaxID=2126352 RepID=A0A2P7UMU4_9BACL|nr:hypothetical protein [Brevibacillus fortis]PSJ88340.1 hypothetical protein C7R93_25630 [Brevibacillus fortis]